MSRHFLFTDRLCKGAQAHFFSAKIDGDGFGWEWYLSIATWKKGDHDGSWKQDPNADMGLKEDRVEWKSVPVPGRGTYERVVEAAYDERDKWAASLGPTKDDAALRIGEF